MAPLIIPCSPEGGCLIQRKVEQVAVKRLGMAPSVLRSAPGLGGWPGVTPGRFGDAAHIRSPYHMELTSIKTSLDNGTLTRTTVTVACGVVYFSSTCERGSAVLEWATASETNSDHFVVERSMDGQAWVEMDRVSAAGNSQQVNEYAFVDPRSATDATTYYRALQFDQDGTAHELTVVASGPCTGNGGLHVFPNPTEGQVTVMLPYPSAVDAYRLELRDAVGRFVKDFALANDRTAYQLSLEGITAGWHLLVLLDEQGTPLDNASLVIR